MTEADALHGVMDRLGLGARAMTDAYPRLIYCSLPGFASDDPRADRLEQFRRALAKDARGESAWIDEGLRTVVA